MSGVVTNPIAVDPLLSAEENLFLAIKGANPTRNIVPAMVHHAPPVAYSHPTDPWYNTEVVLTARPGFRLVGSVTLHYHRDDLNVIGSEFDFAYDNITPLDQLLDVVAEQLGLVATEVKFDVSEMPYADPETSTVTIQLEATTDSLLYQGAISIRWTGVSTGPVRITEEGLLRVLEDGAIRLQDQI